MGALTYSGTPIRQMQEMLSLTDMWRAAGSDDARRPAEWMRSADATRFVSFVADTLNVGVSHTDLVQTTLGGRHAGTFAHWQIGLAYAKYLSPEFHVWCNTVVRDRMEGRGTPEALTASQVGGITKAVVRAALAEIREGIDELRSGYDPTHAVVTDFEPMLRILAGQGVLPKGRRPLVQRCSRLCVQWLLAQGRGSDIRVSRETKRFLFRVPATQQWLVAQGNALIADHKARIAGQSVMQFRLVPKLSPPESQTPA